MRVDVPYAKRRIKRCRQRILVSGDEWTIEWTPSSEASLEKRVEGLGFAIAFYV